MQHMAFHHQDTHLLLNMAIRDKFSTTQTITRVLSTWREVQATTHLLLMEELDLLLLRMKPIQVISHVVVPTLMMLIEDTHRLLVLPCTTLITRVICHNIYQLVLFFTHLRIILIPEDLLKCIHHLEEQSMQLQDFHLFHIVQPEVSRGHLQQSIHLCNSLLPMKTLHFHLFHMMLMLVILLLDLQFRWVHFQRVPSPIVLLHLVVILLHKVNDSDPNFGLVCKKSFLSPNSDCIRFAFVTSVAPWSIILSLSRGE
jgi:hypothetical protein